MMASSSACSAASLSKKNHIRFSVLGVHLTRGATGIDHITHAFRSLTDREFRVDLRFLGKVADLPAPSSGLRLNILIDAAMILSSVDLPAHRSDQDTDLRTGKMRKYP